MVHDVTEKDVQEEVDRSLERDGNWEDVDTKINKNSKNNGLNFINWLESRKAQNIIKNYGFESIYSEENY